MFAEICWGFTMLDIRHLEVTEISTKLPNSITTSLIIIRKHIVEPNQLTLFVNQIHMLQSRTTFAKKT